MDPLRMAPREPLTGLTGFETGRLPPSDFYTLMGMKPDLPSIYHKNPKELVAESDGLYGKIVSECSKARTKYRAFSILSEALSALQFLIGIVLIVLGSLRWLESHIAVAVLGAAVIMVAGGVNLMKLHDLPRLRQARDALHSVEWKAQDLYAAVSAGRPLLYTELNKLRADFLTAKGWARADYPDTWTTNTSEMRARGATLADEENLEAGNERFQGPVVRDEKTTRNAQVHLWEGARPYLDMFLPQQWVLMVLELQWLSRMREAMRSSVVVDSGFDALLDDTMAMIERWAPTPSVRIFAFLDPRYHRAFQEAQRNVDVARQRLTLMFALVDRLKSGSQVRTTLTGETLNRYHPESIVHPPPLPSPQVLPRKKTSDPAPDITFEAELIHHISQEKFHVRGIVDAASDDNFITLALAKQIGVLATEEEVLKPHPKPGRHGRLTLASKAVTVHWRPAGAVKSERTEFLLADDEADLDWDYEFMLGKSFVDLDGIFGGSEVVVNSFRQPWRSRSERAEEQAQAERTRTENQARYEKQQAIDKLNRDLKLQAAVVGTSAGSAGDTAAGLSDGTPTSTTPGVRSDAISAADTSGAASVMLGSPGPVPAMMTPAIHIEPPEGE